MWRAFCALVGHSILLAFVCLGWSASQPPSQPAKSVTGLFYPCSDILASPHTYVCTIGALRSLCFRHWPRSPCNTTILSEQVIGLGMGSWLDLWEKMIMYVLRYVSSACNFTLRSGVLASLMEALHWPNKDQPPVHLRASMRS